MKIKEFINWIKTSAQVIIAYTFLDNNKISLHDNVMLKGNVNKWYVISINSKNIVISRIDDQNLYHSKIVSLNDLTKI